MSPIPKEEDDDLDTIGSNIQQRSSIQIGSEVVLTELELAKQALAGDYFPTRDPNVAALCMCYGNPIYKYRMIQVTYGKRQPQRVVEFQFKGHDRVFKAVASSMLDLRSSLVVQNVSIGEFLANLKNVKTIILSMA